MESVIVRFGEGRIVLPLEVEGPCPGLLTQLCGLLFSMRVQVLGAVEEPRSRGHVVHRFRVCEFDGARLAPRRQKVVTERIASAVRRAIVAQAA